MPMEIGVLPLPQDLVSQGLDARALTLLCPPPLGSPLSISFLPFESEAGVTLSHSACYLAYLILCPQHYFAEWMPNCHRQRGLLMIAATDQVLTVL